MFCGSCGHANDDGAHFCSDCGGTLGGTTQTVTESSPTIVVPPAPPPPADPHQPWYAAPSGSLRGVVLATGAAFVVVAIVLVLVLVLTGNDAREPLAKAALDSPRASVVIASGGSTSIVVEIDFEGSVDNIALYRNGDLVDQASSLGGELVWSNPPEGTHQVVLRSQTGNDVLIGDPTTVIVGSPTDSEPGEAAGTTTTVLETTTSTAAQTTTSTTEATTTTTIPPIGPYIAVLASLPKSTVSLSAAQTSGEKLADDFGIGSYSLVDSDDWESLRDGFWVIASPQNFQTLAEAAAHCWNLGARDASTCFARPVSQNPADLTVVGNPAP